MKNLYKSALLAALGLASVTAVQAASYNGDIIIGFTSTSGNDLFADLGTVANLTDGENFAISGLSAYTLGTVDWAAFATTPQSGAPRDSYTTASTPVAINGVTGWGNYNTSLKNMTLAFSSLSQGQTATIAASSQNSMYSQTINSTLSGQYYNVIGATASTPVVTSGLQTADFYQVIDNGSAPTLFGTFTLNANDSVTFNTVAVPEPTTYGFLAGAGVLALSLRNQFRRKQA